MTSPESVISTHSPVEHIMLKHKEDVKEDREETKGKLGGVAKDGAPIVCEDIKSQVYTVNIKFQRIQLTVIIGNEKHLQNAQESSGKVQQHVANRPTHGTLSSVVHVCLTKPIHDDTCECSSK